MRALATSTLHLGKESFAEGNFTDAGWDACFTKSLLKCFTMCLIIHLAIILLHRCFNFLCSAAELGVACENFAKVYIGLHDIHNRVKY